MAQEESKPGNSQSGVSRRDWMRRGAEAGAAALAAGGALRAQQVSSPGAAANSIAGRKMRAFVRTAQGASVQEVKLLALREDMVAIRTEATQCCYTIVNQALGSGNNGARGAGGVVAARILGHGGASDPEVLCGPDRCSIADSTRVSAAGRRVEHDGIVSDANHCGGSEPAGSERGAVIESHADHGLGAVIHYGQCEWLCDLPLQPERAGGGGAAGEPHCQRVSDRL
jgi:hypothetical protein